MDENNLCPIVGIPERLWVSERDEDQVFEGEEILYRRIHTSLPKDFIDDDDISIELFEIKDDSYNRSKYCGSEKDVLFNTRIEDAGRHYTNWGIVSLTVNDLSVSQPFNYEGRNVVCRLSPIHRPVPCNYSHTEAWFFRDDVKLSTKKPRSMKTLFRRTLLKKLKIIVPYDDEHVVMPD